MLKRTAFLFSTKPTLLPHIRPQPMTPGFELQLNSQLQAARKSMGTQTRVALFTTFTHFLQRQQLATQNNFFHSFCGQR